MIAAEHKEYWRSQFAMAFRLPDEDGNDSNYRGDYFGFCEFDHDLGVLVRYSRMENDAVKVVISFSQWDDSVVDPLISLEEEDIVNWDQGMVGVALKKHLRALKDSQESVSKALGAVKDAAN